MNTKNERNLQELIISRLDLSRQMSEEEVRELIDREIQQESKKRHLEIHI